MNMIEEEEEVIRTNDVVKDDIISVNKDLGKGEHLLPVHFLPEGSKCYDWINEDLKKSEEQEPKTYSRQLSGEGDTPPDTCKGKARTTNSVSYHQAHIIGGGELSSPLANETQLVQKLLSAAQAGDVDSVKDILQTSPLIVNKTDSDGYTALHRACYSGHKNVVTLLLERGANIHSKTDDGWQPLHCAVRWNNIEICKRLLAKNANVNAPTNGRQTPVHLASLTAENQQILEMLLLQPGVDVTIQNAAGDTPYDIARRSGLQYKLFDMVDEALNI